MPGVLPQYAGVALALCALAALVPAPAWAQVATGHTDVIQGRVTTDSGAAIPAADVIVTMAPDRLTRSTKTDSSGRYVITFPNGTGDYLVHFAAVGRMTARRRVTRTGNDTVFTVDAKLAPGAVALAPVRVRAPRNVKPSRDPDFGTGIGGGETFAGGINAALPPDQRGNLDALAGTVPGVVLTPGGPSVLGLPGDQNNATLDGMAFGGGSVPREANTRVRFSTSTYDPARGGFSGAQTAVELQRGLSLTQRPAHLTLDAPFLQTADPVSRGYGQRYTNVDAGIGGSGELVDNRYYYNTAVQASRRTTDVASLLTATPGVLRAAGVAPDSAARLVTLLGAAGAPLGANGIPGSRTEDRASVVARLDHTPTARVAWNVTAYANAARSGATARTPLATPTADGRRSNALGMLQAVRSEYFHSNRALNETRTALTLSSRTAAPYLALPGGTVRVTSEDTAGGTAFLRFGGSGALASATRSLLWQTRNETIVTDADGRHRAKLTLEGRFDHETQSPPFNRYGSFSFNSLADLAAARPALYTRTLTQPDTRAGEWSGFVALGDLWKPSDRFQLLYGARLEGNRFVTRPAVNPAVAEAFGARTDAVPNTVHLSPRVGFTWLPRSERPRSGMFINPVGTFLSPVANLVVRGGIGEFRNFMPSSLVAGAIAGTGLPGSVLTLTCFGPAAPGQDWAAYAADAASIPATCAGGATPSFSDVAPGVRLFDRSYTAPRSWRGNLALTLQRWKLVTTVDGTYSLNLNQPATTDLNFAGGARFALAGEDNRAVFVPGSSIDPATGAVSPVAARRSTSFGRVVDLQSDGRSISRALTVTVMPAEFRRLSLSGSYTLQSVRALARGFDAPTFGSPLAREWARGDLDARHQFTLSAGTWGMGGLSFSLYGRFTSGFPYTPVVGSDVNGDGLPNDRAFVFDPARAGDTALAAGVRSLMESAPRGARGCLARQLGRAAGRNSCTGPWTAMLNARLGISGRQLRLGNRASVVLNLANPLAALDQLLHGSNNLRGWGAQPFPDPVLYTVRGFDPVAGRFLYDVNPRFGSTRAASAMLRAPFRVTLDVSVSLAQPYDVQQLDRTLRPGRAGHAGRRLSADSIAKRYARSIPDPYAQMLAESDSLLLSREQMAALRRADTAYRARMDSVWRSLAEYLAGLGDSYDAAAALRRANAASDSAWKVVHAERPTVIAILSPLQWRLAPGMAKAILDPKVKVGFFFD